MQQIHEPFMRTGNRLKLLDTGKLAFVRAVTRKVMATDYFDSAERSHHVSGKPDFTVSTAANTP